MEKYIFEIVFSLIMGLFGVIWWMVQNKVKSIETTVKDHSQRIEKNTTEIAVNTANDQTVGDAIKEIKSMLSGMREEIHQLAIKIK